MKQYFITGTDTDSGKTVAAKAVLDRLKNVGYKTLAMKPVASGCHQHQHQLQNVDAETLREAMTLDCDYSLTNPYAFEPAIAPHIAAAEAGVKISAEVLKRTHQQLLTMDPDALVIEGAGGWKLPLSETLMMPEFVAAIDAEVILVVGLKLGCLNHALLSAQAILADGLSIAGWIAVNTQPQPMPYVEQNLETLRRCLPAPCIGELPYLADWQQQDLSRYIKI
ncbi:dethiobiotin synthase [Idiomarina seosinensis]|uniref:ATP-dependent dethiobiotin synthetase BioD n=1 Tax=Idiomarina seosinensis TaxID=281739 RepID=A0A432ZI42_9GAMM|nr:dethiobiotin synthase [Idiomarina seosinensis]RUO77599.1 dethiobiotin synthase [Idiomarina seosinensis]